MFSPIFIAVKTIVVMASIGWLLVHPKSTPFILAINILVAVLEAFYKKAYWNALLGWCLVIGAFNLRYNEQRKAILLAYLLLYTAWNIDFYYLGHPDLYSAIPQTLIPFGIAVWWMFYGPLPGEALWIFTLLRVCILTVMLLHTISPISCHRIKMRC